MGTSDWPVGAELSSRKYKNNFLFVIGFEGVENGHFNWTAKCDNLLFMNSSISVVSLVHRCNAKFFKNSYYPNKIHPNKII